MSELRWRKSSFSGDSGNNCVEVAITDGTRPAIRESETPDRVLTPNRAALRALFSTVRADGTASRQG